MVAPRALHFILTNRCNLRCVYCPEGSHDEGYYADLDDNQFDEIMRLVERNGVEHAGLAYYGEMTMVKGWEAKAQRLLDAGVSCQTTTNAHLPWTEAEVATLARMNFIAISIDSHDEETVRTVRKRTSVARIVHNYQLVKAYCLEREIGVPHMVWTGVLTHHVVHQLPRFVAFAAANGALDLRFNEVQLYDGAVEKGLNIIDLDEGAFAAAVASIDRAIEVASRLGVVLVMQELPRIRARQAGQKSDIPLKPRSTSVGPSAAYVESEVVPEGMTRDCGAPLTEMYISPKGEVHSCSNRGAVMGVGRTAEEFEAIYNNAAYQKLRLALLTGGAALDPDCASCAMRPLKPVDPTALSIFRSSI